MTLTGAQLNSPPAPQRLNYAAQRFNQLQADLVSTARMWAADEVGAAVAHQLSEPLTALLLYLHKIKDEGEQSADTPAVREAMRDTVDMALREAERVCDIMERLGHTVEAPVDAETAVARGREVIDAWARNHLNGGGAGQPAPAPSHTGQHLLTPREREVLALITGGASNKEGGPRLGISRRTFEVHRAHIMEKLGARNAADLVRMTLTDVR